MSAAEGGKEREAGQGAKRETERVREGETVGRRDNGGERELGREG